MGFDLEALIDESEPSLTMDGVADKGEAFVPCMLTYAPYLRIRPHVQTSLDQCRTQGGKGGCRGKREGMRRLSLLCLINDPLNHDVAVPWLRLVEALSVGQELWGRRDYRGLSGEDRRAIGRTVLNEV